MNYRHAFHAGNFADVFKHAVLSLLLKSLARKDAAFCYLDTHAQKKQKRNLSPNGACYLALGDTPRPVLTATGNGSMPTYRKRSGL